MQENDQVVDADQEQITSRRKAERDGRMDKKKTQAPKQLNDGRIGGKENLA
jgi:hypothetical protein